MKRFLLTSLSILALMATSYQKGSLKPRITDVAKPLMDAMVSSSIQHTNIEDKGGYKIVSLTGKNAVKLTMTAVTIVVCEQTAWVLTSTCANLGNWPLNYALTLNVSLK